MFRVARVLAESHLVDCWGVRSKFPGPRGRKPTRSRGFRRVFRSARSHQAGFVHVCSQGRFVGRQRLERQYLDQQYASWKVDRTQ